MDQIWTTEGSRPGGQGSTMPPDKSVLPAWSGLLAAVDGYTLGTLIILFITVARHPTEQLEADPPRAGLSLTGRPRRPSPSSPLQPIGGQLSTERVHRVLSRQEFKFKTKMGSGHYDLPSLGISPLLLAPAGSTP